MRRDSYTACPFLVATGNNETNPTPQSVSQHFRLFKNTPFDVLDNVLVGKRVSLCVFRCVQAALESSHVPIEKVRTVHDHIRGNTSCGRGLDQQVLGVNVDHSAVSS